MKNKLKEKLLCDKTCIGMFFTVGSTELVEIAGITGYDFAVFDMEHGPYNAQSILPLLIAAERRGLCPIVRIPEIAPSVITRILDIGAQGLQAPQVSSAQETDQLTQYSKYYPKGSRGMGSPRAGDYGYMNLNSYIKDVNRETLLIAQCESKEGYEHLDEIAACPDIDVVFLGPYDMSQSLGTPGSVHSQTMDNMREKVIEVCRQHRKIPGTFAQDGKEAKRLKEMGFRYLTIGMDVDHVLSKFKEEADVFHESIDETTISL